MFMGDELTLSNVPGGGKIEWLKSLSISGGDGLGSIIHPWSVYLMVPMFHMLDVVYVRGGMH